MSEETPTVEEVQVPPETTTEDAPAADADADADAVPPVASPTPKPALTAREKAAARRRRILERGKDRMEAVSGAVSQRVEAVSDALSGDKDATDAAPAAEDAAPDQEEPSVEKTEDDAADASPVEGNDGDASAAAACKTSGSSRLAQMRRRRYKKAAEAAAKKEAEGGDEEGETAEPVAEADVNTDTAPEAEEAAEEDAKDTACDKASNTKKKYVGVAKTRRKMLAEKKKAEEEALADELKTFAAQIPKKPDPRSIPKGPVLIQLLTVICLFLSGFDIGMQNHAFMKQDVPFMYFNLSIKDHGIGVLYKLGNKNGAGAKSTIQSHDFGSVTDNLDFTEEDEFGNAASGKTKPAGATSESTTEGNIDPLFGVDFDKLTAGPGLFMMMARFAVSIHRSITYFVYTLPLSILHAVMAGPKKLFRNPPIMFLCAILIRLIGKHLLGGNIPSVDDIIAEEEKKLENEKNCDTPELSKTDFVSMGKNFVKNTIKGKFPKVVMAFTAFKQARADMFVVICGLFVGLIFPAGLLQSTIVSEEL